MESNRVASPIIVYSAVFDWSNACIYKSNAWPEKCQVIRDFSPVSLYCVLVRFRKRDKGQKGKAIRWVEWRTNRSSWPWFSSLMRIKFRNWRWIVWLYLGRLAVYRLLWQPDFGAAVIKTWDSFSGKLRTQTSNTHRKLPVSFTINFIFGPSRRKIPLSYQNLSFAYTYFDFV